MNLKNHCFREGNGNPLQYSCLENPMDGGAWWAAVHGVTKSQTLLSDFTFTFHFHALEKEMTGEPGGLLSMQSHRIRHEQCPSTVLTSPLIMNFLPKYPCLKYLPHLSLKCPCCC